MIDVFVMMLHWCASCASDGNVIPGALGAAGGTAGALGSVGPLTPMSDLLPPGTQANPDGSLTWQNPDGTTSTKAPNGAITTTSATGPTTTKYPGGGTETTAPDGTRTVTTPDGHTITWRPDETQTNKEGSGPSTITPYDGLDGDNEKIVGPHDPDPMDDPSGNAIPGFVGGLAVGGVNVALEGASEAAVKTFVQERASDGIVEGAKLGYEAVHGDGAETGAGGDQGGADEHPGEYDEPDATVPDASLGGASGSESGDAGAPSKPPD